RARADLGRRDASGPARRGAARAPPRDRREVPGPPDARGRDRDQLAPRLMPSRRPTRLETFDNPAPERDYEIVHTAPEFTSVCPITGQPDFGTIVVTYVPDRLCLELKALKLYFFEFRDRGVFYEAVVNRILEDLVAACAPRRMEV